MRVIKLNKKKCHNEEVVMVDDEDYDFLNQYNWYLHKRRTKVYAARTIWFTDQFGKKKSYTVSMHRVLMGVDDPKIIIDHKNMNGLDNRKENLRICTISQNNANIMSRKNSSSKYLGVSKVKYGGGMWTAQIRKDRRSYFLGAFKSEADAALAYNTKAKEFHGEFANLNIIE